MSSVGSSDPSDRSAEQNLLRRTREEFRQRESDLIKRHNIDARRVAETHEDEIERLKANHGEQLESVKEHSSDTISARDQKHQREIEGIRNLARKQLQSSADESARRDDTLRKTIDAEKKQRSKYTDGRFEKLNDDFKGETRRIADSYASRAEAQKASQDEAVDKLRGSLNKRHETELEALRESLGEKIEGLDKSFADYRKDVNQERQDTKLKGMQGAHQAGDQLLKAVRREREIRNDNENNLREDYKEALAGERERFGEALSEQAEAARNAQRSYKTNTGERSAGRVAALKRENNELRESAVREQSQLRRQSGKELTNARDAFQKNVDAYRRERDEAYRQGNDANSGEVGDVRDKLESRLVETTRDYRDKLDQQARTFRTSYDNLKGDFQARSSQKDQLTDARIEHVIEKSNEEKARMTDRERENLLANQRVKQDAIKSLRGSFENDKQTAIEQMREQMRKQELGHQERMGSVVGKYEKQVQTLKDDLLRERKLNTENTKRLTEELQHAHQLELDQAEAKSRGKLGELNQRHSQDVRDVTKRYEEKLDQILGELKKS